MKRAQFVGFVLSIFALVVILMITEITGLTDVGKGTFALLIFTLILLVTEGLPIGVTCILSIGMMVILKTANLSEALSGYTNSIVFFVLVSFGISKAITKVPLSKRLLVKLIETFGRDVKTFLLALMTCAGIISSIMSNVAATAIFIPIVKDFLTMYKDSDDECKTGKTFMIGIPIASMIGGMITPAGSSLNLLIIGLLEQQAGITITFIEWMVYGIPTFLFLLPVAWYIIVKVYKPFEINAVQITDYVDRIRVTETMGFNEIYVLTLFIGMFTLWVLSSWFPVFNITVVAIFGFAMLYLPKVQIITWEEFTSNVSWEAFFLVGTIISLGNVIIKNGVSDWIVQSVFPSTLNMPIQGVIFVMSIIVFVLLILIPVAPALIAMLAPPYINLAISLNISPVLLIMALGLCSANCYLLPLDTVPLLTYATGYYKMADMSKSAAFIQIALAIFLSVWLPIGVGFFS